MGTLRIGLFLCFFVGELIAVQPLTKYWDALFYPDFAGFFDNFRPFSFERNLDFPPDDAIFSSWQTPDFDMFDFNPMMNVPRVQVFCDESMLTVLVDKKSFGLQLTGEEIQLGNGCFSNGELPNQFVFSYRFDQCGTVHVIQDGLKFFTNSLHLTLKKPLPSLWQTPPNIHISCIPKRSYDDPDIIWKRSENGKRFTIEAMTSTWSSAAETNVYERGQVVNLQISAKIRPNEQLFIHSCFVSASPEPHTKPRHAVILNKGCASSMGSPYPVVQFTASNTTDVVNFVLNTSYLTSELYIHCSVLISDQGVTCGSKACNYNVIQSRWEELNGDVEVCDCCSSKCKSPSFKLLPGAKAMVSAGPFIVVDRDDEMHHALLVSEPQTSHKPVPNPRDSGTPEPADDTVSGTSVSNKFLAPRQGVVAVRQEPAARWTLWLPGQAQGAQHDDGQPSDSAELQPSMTTQESSLNSLSNNKGQSLNALKSDPSMWDLNLLTMVGGWPISPQPDMAVIAEDFKRNNRLEGSGNVGTEAAQVDFSLPPEISVDYLMLVESPTPPEAAVAIAKESRRKRRLPDEVNANDLNQNDFKQRDELAQMQMEDANVVGPIIRSKVEFSKGMDGSQKLSYEEEVKQNDKGVFGQLGRDALKRKREPRLKGLCSTFLYLLRRMDKAE